MFDSKGDILEPDEKNNGINGYKSNYEVKKVLEQLDDQDYYYDDTIYDQEIDNSDIKDTFNSIDKPSKKKKRKYTKKKEIEESPVKSEVETPLKKGLGRGKLTLETEKLYEFFDLNDNHTFFVCSFCDYKRSLTDKRDMFLHLKTKHKSEVKTRGKYLSQNLKPFP